MIKFFTGQKINKKTEEVEKMRKTGLMLLLFLGIVIVPMFMPDLSFGWTTYNYSYGADGTMTARGEVQENGTVLSRASYDNYRRLLRDVKILEGADQITTYTYNEFNGASVSNTRIGNGDNINDPGEVNKSTFFNAYRQALATVNNVLTGNWQIFSGRGTGGNTGNNVDGDANYGYRDANRDGTVGIQVAGGAAAFQAMLALGLGTNVIAPWVTSSGLEFGEYTGRQMETVYTYNALGQTTTYNLSTVKVGGPPDANGDPTPRPFNADSVGHTLYVSSFSTTGANGQELSGRNYNRNDMADIGTYTDHPRFDPIIQVSGMLGRDSNNNLTLRTSDGVTHTLVVSEALARQLANSTGSNVTLVVDVLDDGRYSLRNAVV